MRKLGKKFSYLTKVLLVLGLLFSNLSSLSVVFAYEQTDDFTAVTVIDDKAVKVNYLEEIDDTDVVTITLNESYTYLDDTTETPVVTECTTTGSEIKADSGMLCASSLLSSVIFDGLYEVSVDLYNETDQIELGTVLADAVVNSFEEGLAVSVSDSEDNVLTANENGVYEVSGDIKLTAKINAGGLAPTYTYNDGETTYTAKELLEAGLEFTDTVELTGNLYGEYVVTNSVEMLDANGEVVSFNTDINLLYGEYADNTAQLESAKDAELSGVYEFSGESTDNQVYVYGEGRTVNELYTIVSKFVETFTNTTYTIGNGEYADIKTAYDEYVLATGDSALTFAEFCEDILVDNATVITLISDELVVTYTVSIVGDLNNDLQINEDDLLELIDQTIGASESDLTNSDFVEDQNLDIKDVAYLKEVLANSWNVSISEVEAILDASLEVKSDNIVSGDTFTVEYILSLTEDAVSGISGQITYDEAMLELISEDITSYEEWIGNNNDGKFLYVGDSGLVGTEVVNDDSSVTYEEANYVVLTLTFKALSAGTSTVEIADPEFINGSEYLIVDGLTISTDVTVNASSDNELESLSVAGQEIALEEGVLGYEITVSNDVVEPSIEAITKNIAANVTSIVAPEQLEVGENTITIVVTAENGDEKIYTITVIREEAEEETTTTTVSYQNDTTDTEEQDDVVIDDDTNDSDDNSKDDDTKSEEEESNLSRIIIIILILLVIAGLIYLIFKDEDEEDKEVKKANKDIDKLKKEDSFETSNEKKNDKPKNTKKGNSKNNGKKGR